MVELLLDQGADIEGTDDIGGTALMMAAEMGRVDIVERLIERGADVNSGMDADTALKRANCNGHTEVINYLLAHGARR